MFDFYCCSEYRAIVTRIDDMRASVHMCVRCACVCAVHMCVYFACMSTICERAHVFVYTSVYVCACVSVVCERCAHQSLLFTFFVFSFLDCHLFLFLFACLLLAPMLLRGE